MLPKTLADLALMIDHTLLRADANEKDIRNLCTEAIQHNFFSVCVNPRWLPLAAKLLKDESTVPISVIGFPLGANLNSTKVREAEHCLRAQAQELDMVIDIGALKSEAWDEVRLDIQNVLNLTKQTPLKVILETALLTPSEIVRASEICVDLGVAFLKTSTGFANRGASLEDIQIMAKIAGKHVGIKASGGVKSFAFVRDCIIAGATRIGTSASVKIIDEAKVELLN